MAAKPEKIDAVPGKDEAVNDLSAVGHINEAIADIKGHASPQGLTPQQQLAVNKLEVAARLLMGTQTKPPRK